MMNEYLLIFIAAFTGFWGFIAGQIYEAQRPQREAKKEAIRRLTREIMQENR